MPTDQRRTRSERSVSPLHTPGLGPVQEKALNVALVLVLILFTGGWGWVVAEAAADRQALGVTDELAASPLADEELPRTGEVLDRLLGTVDEARWGGRSGAVRAVILEPGDSTRLQEVLGLDSLPGSARVERLRGDTVARGPGVYSLLLRLGDQARRIADVSLLDPVPADLIENGRLGDYLIGEWPGRAERSGRLRSERYDAPAGLIAVTPENRDVRVTRHLTLGDFLTKGQRDVWPKYVAITPELLDKVELTLQELERRGHPVENVGVISGFRTPYYNAHGGSTAGRGSVSRHMYGDALDFYVDNDGDGRMDDLNGDGRVDKADARVIASAAGEVEREYPEYVGGIGVYAPRPGAHSGFVHIDSRGYRARW